MKSLLMVAVFIGIGVFTCTAQRSVGSISVNYPGLLNTFRHTSGTFANRYSILVSTCNTNRNTYDNASILYLPGSAMETGFNGYQPRLIYNQFYCPKEITQVPGGIFDFDAIAVPDGSTIFGKTEGSVYISNVKDLYFPATHNVLKGKLPSRNTFMYTNVIWLQGDIGWSWDMLTCRVTYEGDRVTAAELLFIEHPAERNEMDSQWSSTVLKDTACDAFLDITSFNLAGIGGKYDVVYATSYYLQKLVLYYTTNSRWTDRNKVREVVLGEGKQFYDIKIVDVNNDGKKDLLVTVVDRYNGSVEVWEIPSDFRNVNGYVRHVIAQGFAARTTGTDGRSPGVARTFHLNTMDNNRKPLIALTGADDGRAYVLSPASSDTKDWTYTIKTIADFGPNQVVSGIAAADVDADAFTELFVSSRNTNSVKVFSYSPAPAV